MPRTLSPSKRSPKLQVAVLGGGGRESAFVESLLSDKNVATIHFIAPNAGFAQEERVKKVFIDLHDQSAVVKYCKDEKISLALAGSEELAVIGLNDKLKKAGISVFGASKSAVRIESDKAWARKVMSTLGIPQPLYAVFSDPKKAQVAAEKNETFRIVKAFGPASGKGVYVCDSLAETKKAIKEIMIDKKFGDSGNTVVLEERLGWHDPKAEEVSMMFYTDGKTLAALPLAKDHKREFDHDKGKNTGGMGTFSPSVLLSKKEQHFVQKEIAQKVVGELSKQGKPFTGILYVGLMKTNDTSRNPYGIFVIEINGRGGDPETQVQLASQKNAHPSEIFLACTNGTLAQCKPHFDTDIYLDVVLCSQAYPASKTEGEKITGISAAEGMGVRVLHAGTKMKDGRVVTNGGRILNVVGHGKTLKEARKKVYAAVKKIRFAGKVPKYRHDIGEQS